MSIALFRDLHQEVRRLAVAGSDLAIGDVTLKKFIPPLQKLGQTTPVCQKICALLEQLLQSPEQQTAARLLELSTLLSSVLYTMASSAVAGDEQEVDTMPLSKAVQHSCHQLLPVIQAILTTGSGRYEIIREAHEAGLFQDFRMVYISVYALQDAYSEIADYFMREIIPQYGPAILPLLRSKLDPQGGKKDARIVQCIANTCGLTASDLYRELVESGSNDVKVAAIRALASDPDAEELLLQLSREKKKDVREAALHALAGFDSPLAVERLIEAYRGKDQEAALSAFSQSDSIRAVDFLLAEIEQYLTLLHKGGSEFSKEETEQVSRTVSLLEALHLKEDGRILPFVQQVLRDSIEFLMGHKGYSAFSNGVRSVVIEAADQLMKAGTPAAYEQLEGLRDVLKNEFLYLAFEASLSYRTPVEVYEMYAAYVGKREKKGETPGYQLRKIMDSLSNDHQYSWISGLDRTTEHRLYNRAKILPQDWDPRWLDLYIGLNDEEMALRFCVRPDERTHAYLLTKLGENSKLTSRSAVNVFEVLFRLQHPQASALAFKALQETDPGSFTGWIRRTVEVLKQLEPSYAEAVREIAAQTSNETWKEGLYEVAHYLQQKQS